MVRAREAKGAETPDATEAEAKPPQEPTPQEPRKPAERARAALRTVVAVALRAVAVPWLLLARAFGALPKSMHPFARFCVQALALAGVIGATAALPRLVTGTPHSAATSRRNAAPTSVPYSALVHLANKGCVDAAVFDSGSDRVTFRAYASLSERAKARTALAALDAHNRAVALARSSQQPASALQRVLSSRAGVLSGGASTSDAALPPAPPLPKAPKVYATRRLPGAVDANLLAVLSKEHRLGRTMVGPAAVSVATPTFAKSLGKALSYALLLWLPLAPLFFIMRSVTRGMGDRNGTNARRDGGAGGKGTSGTDPSPAVTFADVAGSEQAKRELEEVVACLRADDPSYEGLEHLVPRGVLLAGPPGTGKTLLARAVAGEAGVAFFSISASEFVEMFVGRGAARVRSLFAEARKNAPAVVFLDEIDAVGGKRGRGMNDERDQTLNQLLTELDGFDEPAGKRVVVLAATNRPDSLDAALLRSGRFTRKVFVELPTRTDREAIAALQLRRVPVAGGDVASLSRMIADMTDRCSGADLAALVSDAALLSVRRIRAVKAVDPEARVVRGVTAEDVREAAMRLKRGVDSRGEQAPLFSRGWSGGPPRGPIATTM